MAIHAPGRVLLLRNRGKVVRDRAHGGGRKSVDSPISLVPFIDFLIVLVVFLLSSFGRDVVAQDRTLQLPDGVNTEALIEAPVIAINRNVVSLDGRRIVDTASLAAEAAVSRIEPLVADLEMQRRNWPALHPRTEFAGAIIIQADVHTDYRVIKKVMFSAAQAGYANVSFAVNARSAP